MINFDYSKALSFIKEDEIFNLAPHIKIAHDMLHNGTGAGSDYTGWVELPVNYDRKELSRIKEAAEKIRQNSEVVIVAGIGGSYLGAKAAIDILSHSFSNILPAEKRKAPHILFAGNNLSSTYLCDLLDVIQDKDLSVIVISKSGTTTETSIAFRVLREHMENKYGKAKAAERIYAVTDKDKGALKKLADEEGYTTFVLPADIGGRYSVLTPVGLLPIAVSGADIDMIMEGAAKAYQVYSNSNVEINDCYKYAAARNALYRKNKTIEILAGYEPSLHYFIEWWKQLYGESEGKDQKGIFPAGVDLTTDLHSMGQYIQDGLRNIFETVLNVQNPRRNMTIKEDKDNIDGLNFLAGMDLDTVNKKAMEGTILAHTDGGVPNLVVSIERLDEKCFGSMVYFFEKACGISGYLMGLNPFNQPGVEAYKKNMFALLGKPGYENERENLEKRLKVR